MKKTVLSILCFALLIGCSKKSDNKTVAPTPPPVATLDTAHTTTFILDTSRFDGEVLNGVTINYCTPANVEIDSVSMSGGYGGKFTATWTNIGGSKFRTDLPTYIASDTAHSGKGGYLIGIPYTGPSGHRLAGEQLKLMIIVNKDTTFNQL